MSDLARQLAEDKALRDAARAVVDADITFLKEEYSPSALGSRMAGGAGDVFDQAVAVADDNKGVLATLVGAVALWFARNPILSLIEAPEDGEASEPETDDGRLGEEN